MEKGALFGKYEVGRLLGCGAFAKVYFARNIRNGQSVAIKIINKKKLAGSSSLMGNIKREITIMSRLRHPYIVRLHEVLATKSKIFFVIDLVKGGELFAKVAKGRFSEDLARKYFQQLISALRYCHSRGVYHRDLKPENLLVDDNGDLKVSDFGLSALKDQIKPDADGLLHTLCGTPAYVAPEILAKKGYHGAKVDVWSSGVILYVLTAGYLPFNDPNLMAMYKKIYKGDFRCPKWMSSDLKRFLSRLLDTNPNTRFTIDHIIRDPWFTKGGVFKDQAPDFVFQFHHQYHYDEDSDDTDCHYGAKPADADDKETPLQLLDSSSSCSLNAFDLISFSSGLDLSGLFDHSFHPVVDGDRFVSAEPFDKILEKLEQVCTAHHVKLKRNKDCVFDLRGSNGNFVAKLKISPLTDQILVVEVKKRGGDTASFNHVWKNRLRPDLSDLVHDPHTQPPTETEMETTTLPAPPDEPSVIGV